MQDNKRPQRLEADRRHNGKPVQYLRYFRAWDCSAFGRSAEFGAVPCDCGTMAGDALRGLAARAVGLNDPAPLARAPFISSTPTVAGSFCRRAQYDPPAGRANCRIMPGNSQHRTGQRRQIRTDRTVLRVFPVFSLGNYQTNRTNNRVVLSAQTVEVSKIDTTGKEDRPSRSPQRPKQTDNASPAGRSRSPQQHKTRHRGNRSDPGNLRPWGPQLFPYRMQTATRAGRLFVICQNLIE